MNKHSTSSYRSNRMGSHEPILAVLFRSYSCVGVHAVFNWTKEDYLLTHLNKDRYPDLLRSKKPVDQWKLQGYKPIYRSKKIHLPVAKTIENLLQLSVFPDRLYFFIHRDYIDESNALVRSYPIKKNPHLDIRYHGDYCFIAIMGEILDPLQDLYEQSVTILKEIFQFAGFIPILKKGFYKEKELPKKQKEYQPPAFTSNDEMFLYWLSQVKFSCLEICWPIGLGTPEDYFKTDELFRSHDKKHKMRYSPDYIRRENGKRLLSTFGIYDCSEKEGLPEPFTKFEVKLFRNRIGIELEDLRGDLGGVINRFERSIKESMDMLERKRRRFIGNMSFLTLYANRDDIPTKIKVPTEKQKVKTRLFNYMMKIKRKDKKISISKMHSKTDKWCIRNNVKPYGRTTIGIMLKKVNSVMETK